MLPGFDRWQAQDITNDQVDSTMRQFGDIIVPSQDVFAECFLTGKKKLRVDLNKGKEIPRDFHMQAETPTGRTLTVSLRVFYKDQPYHCRRCTEEHVGDCPKFLAEKEEKQQIQKVKLNLTKTAMIGDSNYRCVNENGVMASVTAVTGGKIGHISNQVRFEDLSKMENVILAAGQNCTNDVDELDEKFWQARTLAEVSKLESVVNKLMEKGKNVIMLGVPPAPCTQTSARKRNARLFVNKSLTELVQRANTIDTKPGRASFLSEADTDFTESLDFKDERHLSEHAMERRIALIDGILPDKCKLKSMKLKARATCGPYRGCYGAYPAGCMFCTEMNHSEQDCPRKHKHGQKRQEVSGSDEQNSKYTKQE